MTAEKDKNRKIALVTGANRGQITQTNNATITRYQFFPHLTVYCVLQPVSQS